jgi:Kef-type K+ transport system membrane component KefB
MSKRIFYPPFLLLIPLIGMTITDEINWSPFDFIIMGSLLILLSIGINFMISRVKNLKNRVLYIGVVVIIFMLIWAELAVGLFGTPFAGS